MTQRANILEELNALGSSLASQSVQPVFSVPEGYFAGLADVVLSRIRAMEAHDAVEELEFLSPELNKISRQMPYEVPGGYFEALNESLAGIIGRNKTSKEELSEISPLLAGIDKQMPYTIPQGYFENLNTGNKPDQAKVVSITSRRWFKFAAAAMITGVITLAGFIYFNSKPDPVKDPHAWVKKSIKKVDKAELDEFIKLADEENQSSVVTVPVKTEELKELMKDVSDKELQDFLNETSDAESVEDVMMN